MVSVLLLKHSGCDLLVDHAIYELWIVIGEGALDCLLNLQDLFVHDGLSKCWATDAISIHNDVARSITIVVVPIFVDSINDKLLEVLGPVHDNHLILLFFFNLAFLDLILEHILILNST